MRTLPILIIAGAAATALAAAAATPRTHLLTVQLPGGAVEQFRYTGDAPPRISIDAVPISAADFAPVAMDPFADFDRISAEMDREMAAILSAAPTLAGGPGLSQAALSSLPAGGQSFSMVSTFSGGHACMRSVEVTSQGPGKAPRVVNKTSGDCGAGAAPSAPAARAPALARPGSPRTPV